MKKIVLFCAAGMSTSLLVTKMRKAAQTANLAVQIDAYSVGLAELKGKDADCILIGPQVRYLFDKVKSIYPTKPVEVIDMESYGMMDGMAVLKKAVRLINDRT